MPQQKRINVTIDPLTPGGKSIHEGAPPNRKRPREPIRKGFNRDLYLDRQVRSVNGMHRSRSEVLMGSSHTLSRKVSQTLGMNAMLQALQSNVVDLHSPPKPSPIVHVPFFTEDGSLSLAEVEPWDLPFLKAPMYSARLKLKVPSSIHQPDFTEENAIHPRPTYLVHTQQDKEENLQNKPIELLSEIERMKLFRRKKLASLREQAIQSRLGLGPIQDQHLKMKHMQTDKRLQMAASEHGATIVEAAIKAQIKARLDKHKHDNLRRHEAAVEHQAQHRTERRHHAATDDLRLMVWSLQWASECPDAHSLERVRLNATQRELNGLICRIDSLSLIVMVLFGGRRAMNAMNRLICTRMAQKGMWLNQRPTCVWIGHVSDGIQPFSKDLQKYNVPLKECRTLEDASRFMNSFGATVCLEAALR